MGKLPRLGKLELICLLLFTCNYVVSVWRGFPFLWLLGMGYVILLWHSLSLPYNTFKSSENIQKKEGGPDRSVSDNQSSSVTLNELAKKARKIL